MLQKYILRKLILKAPSSDLAKQNLLVRKALHKPNLRLVLATSIDGRITFAQGGPGKIGGKGDRKVLEEALKWADATLMGGGTLREHKSTCLIKDSKLLKERLMKGKSQQPISIVVGKEKSFSRSWEFFKQPIERWLITPVNNVDQKSCNVKFQRKLFIKNKWKKILKGLKKEGLNNIALLGGTKLIGSLLKEDLVNEIQLTISPRILGGYYPWTPLGNKDIPIKLSHSNSWLLNNTELLEENELVIKYIRNKK